MNWTTEKRSEYQRLMRYGDQRAYCIPIEGRNEAFVMTNYPGTLKNGEDGTGRWPHSNKDLVIFIAVTVVVGIAVISAVYYIWRAMRKSRKSSADLVKQ